MSAMILASVNLSNVYSIQPFISLRDLSLSIFPHLYFHALGVTCEAMIIAVFRFVMESGTEGREVVISGKLRATRAKSMKFTDGFMIHSGQPAPGFAPSDSWSPA